MRLRHSNRMEVLAAELADLMRTHPGDPFAPERIVVPHPTIGQWLSLELARALGIAANVRFEQPAEFAWSIIRGVVPELSREQPFSPARLRWRIHHVLPEFARERWGGAVRGYLADGDPRKRFELADRLARVFDRCLLYRPDWIREWERGAAPHWQARLWQLLVGTKRPAEHWVAAIDSFREARSAGESPSIRSSNPSPGSGARHSSRSGDRSAARPRVPSGARPPGWPLRASFFAVPALSPSYLEMLCEAARGIDLHLFMLNPCREYWGDIYSRRELDRRAGGADPGERYLTEGNELLAGWGRAGRDTFDSLVEIASAGFEERFEAPDGAHRLAAVQRDILDLRLASEATEAAETEDAEETEEASQAAEAVRAGGTVEPECEADDSIRIHVCHSPLREAEVLHDRLLRLFDTHRDIEPADVLVLTPSLAVYAPAIEAVFGAAGRIPINVAHAAGGGSRTLRAFLDLLDLPGSRLGAEAVLAPLDAPAVRTRFGIDEADLPVVRGLVREAGIRWGADEAHRGAEGLPETVDHTWRQGLRRLLLGYAMPAADVLVAGIVPCPAGVDGREIGGELLGRFVSYCEEVLGLRDRLTGERRPVDWGEALRGVVQDFLADGLGPVRGAGGARNEGLARELAGEVSAVRGLIRAFEREVEGAESPVSFAVVRDVVREHAREVSGETARLADGVTVAPLASGCIFPAKVVCVAGMNDGAFPRSPSFPSFDVVAAGPVRRGDRDVRHEDRFAFLEALLAARRCFLVTCTGRGLRDDAPIPPSVLVDELKDYLGRRFPGAPIETRHPLQPFSPRYFAISGNEAAGRAGPAGESPDEAAETAGRATIGAAGVEAGAPARTLAHTPAGTTGAEDLFSYSHGMCEAARAMVAGWQGSGYPGRFAAGLPEPDASRRRAGLAELIAFFANPTRFLLRERLGVRLEVDDAALDDEEPFELDGLERYRLRSDIREQIQAGIEPARAAALLRGYGRLPQAGLGRIVHEDAREEVEQLERQLAPHGAALAAPPREIDFDFDEFRIAGTVEHAGPDGMVWWRIGRLRARDRIEIWLRQLAWAAAGHGPLEAIGISLERGSWKTTPFPAPERTGEQLERWLDAWWRGLTSPLPFFPETSLAYADAIVRFAAGGAEAAEEAAWARAHGAWFGDPYRRGERLDPYLGLVHDRDDTLQGAFADLATELLVPLVGGTR